MSATSDSTITNPEQRIADLERRLAEREAELPERTAERDEAQQRETATAEVLQVIDSSPGDLVPVFDAILDKATHLCETAFGELNTFDGTRFSTAAVRGETPDYLERRRQNPPDPSKPGTMSARILDTRCPVHVLDIAAEAAHKTGLPSRRVVSDTGVRTALAVPLLRDEQVVGFISVYRREVRAFTDKQIALLQNFAAQAVIAMENARLITETREALEQQTATAEVLGVINSSPGDLAPVFDAMLGKATGLCEADFGILLTYEESGYRAAALRNVPPAYADVLREPLHPGPKTALGRVARGDPVAQIVDIAADEELLSEPMVRGALEVAGFRTVLAVPLRQEGKLLGAFTIYRQEVRAFTDKQIALLQNFAAQAVIAMENARLITETREALEQQTATAEVLGVINSSPGDLQPVFGAMLDKAMRLCEANFGFLSTYDGQHFTAVALHGLPDTYVEEYLTGPYLPGPNTTHDRLVRGELVVHVPNLAVDSADSPRRRFVIEVVGVRSILAVPLRKDGALLGAIHVFRQEVRPFSDKQIALLQNFAAQAVIAIENARLLDELRQRTNQIAELNHGLEARVAEQVDELGRVGRLKRFLAPQLAELIVSQGDENILESHRREIVVVFCDLRGYTAFTETAEPEEVLEFLRQYHGALGPLVSQFEGTLDQFSGDGIMVFFNDPVPCPDPAERAVKMAMAMRAAASDLIAAWRRHGSDLGFGAGIAQGYATLGQIGFSDRSGYTAIGTVCNLAARLCAEAKDGQILVSSRIAEAVEAVAVMENLGDLELKGLRRPVAAFNVVQSAGAPDARPNLTVVAREPGV
jgi:adenylate cyclase